MTPRHHRGTGRASRSGADGSDDLDGPDAYTAVSLTLAHVCAINAGSQVACWGTDYHLESGQPRLERAGADRDAVKLVGDCRG